MASSKFYCNKNLMKVETAPFVSGQLYSFTAPHPDRKDLNQDSIGYIEFSKDVGLLLLADGIGGHRGGDKASRLIVRSIISSLRNLKKSSLIQKAPMAMLKANEKVRKLNIGAGSTLTLCLIIDGVATIFSTGDSRAYIYSSAGNLKFKTLDLSVEGLAAAAGVSSNENALYYYVGDQTLSFMTYGPIELSPQDSIILCSDGIHGNITDDEISEIIKSSKEDTNKGELLLQQVKSNFINPDDHSFLYLDPRGVLE